MNRRCIIQLVLGLSGISAGLTIPDSVYVFRDDVIMVEAEDLRHRGEAAWKITKEIPGYTGSGYLQYFKENRMCVTLSTAISDDPNIGVPTDFDEKMECQGTAEEQVWIPVYFPQAGSYSVNLVNYSLYDAVDVEPLPQERTDVDFSVWVHTVDNPNRARYYVADHQNRWDWMEFCADYETSQHVARLLLLIDKPQVRIIYIAGRNKDFKLDRIAVYRKIGINKFPPNYRSRTTPVSKLVSYKEVMQSTAATPLSPRRDGGVVMAHQTPAFSGSVMCVDMHGRALPADLRKQTMRLIYTIPR